MPCLSSSTFPLLPLGFTNYQTSAIRFNGTQNSRRTFFLETMRQMLCFYNNIVQSQTNFCFKTLVHNLSTTAPNPQNLPHNPLVVEHLITKYGVSKTRAISASKRFHRSTTLSTLTSVPHFLKQNGFSDTHITNLISKEPKLLSAKIDKTLEPKLKFLEQQLGFFPSSLAEFIVRNPTIFFFSIDNHLIPMINVLRSLLHSNEKIVKVLNKTSWFISSSPTKLSLYIDFFRQYGLPDDLISLFLLLCPRLFSFKLDLIKDILERVDEFGVERDSPAFIYAVLTVSSMSKGTLERKFQVYKSYGLVEADILQAFRNYPQFLTLSEEKIRKMMSFYLDELGSAPEDIIVAPRLLSFSLEKRLKPRNEVLKILTSKGLLETKNSVRYIMAMTEDKFFKNYVVKFVQEAPNLEEVYKVSGIIGENSKRK